jgi:hypothetical protein
MSDADDVLGKADALLNRYRPGSGHAPTADIPVLTEVVELDPKAADPASSFPAAPPSPVEEAVSAEQADEAKQELAAEQPAGDAAAALPDAPPIADEESAESGVTARVSEVAPVPVPAPAPALTPTAEQRAEDLRRHVMAALEEFLGEEFDLRLRAGLDLAVHRLAFDLLDEVRGELDTRVREAVAKALAGERAPEHDATSGPDTPRNPL